MKKCFLIMALLVIESSCLHAEFVSGYANYSGTSLMLAGTSGGYEKVFLGKTDLLDKTGEPQLPVDKKYISLPGGAVVDSVKVFTFRKEILDGNHNIYPAQPQMILSKITKDIEFTQPQAAIYEADSPYPGKLIEYKGSGYLNGNNIAEILVYPVQVNPPLGSVELYTSIGFNVYYHNETIERLSAGKGSFIGQKLFNGSIETLTGAKPENLSCKSDDPGLFEYLIITKSPFDTVFQRLADWKTAKGVPAAIRTVDWIASAYPGKDVQEKIRNYLQIAQRDSGLIFLLLGGDVNVVPVRNAFAMDCEMSGGRDNIFPCDLYYSDLDGTWNADGDTIYGEIADSVDLYPDIFVGRAGVDTLSEARAFVEKILTYERNPPLDYLCSALFDADVLWDIPYTDEGIAKEMIAKESFPDRYTINKNYPTQYSGTSSFDWVNIGQSFINHCGHGWINGGLFGISQTDAFTNNPRNGIQYSIGCWTNAFDFDAVSEHFVNNPNGGGVAYIGNTSYGWGSPGNPGYGYSDLFDAAFFRELFLNDFYHLGMTLAQAKTSYIAHSREENVYRWHQYDVNLIGDPEMPVWTDIPQSLEVSCPTIVPLGINQVRVAVKCNQQPVSGAVVCLQRDPDIYQRGYTDDGGIALLEIAPNMTGMAKLTVSGHNFIPHQAEILIGDSLAYIDIVDFAADDSAIGNGDGLVNPGETIDLSVALKNFGKIGTSGIVATVGCADTLVSVLDSQCVFGTISSGETSYGSGSYRFVVSGNAGNGYPIVFDFQITDDSSQKWISSLSLPVCRADLKYIGHVVNDSAGNGIAEPGETVAITMNIKNIGRGIARSASCSLSTDDASFTIIDTAADLGTIYPDSSVSANFNLQISPGSPQVAVGVIRVKLKEADGFSAIDSIPVEIGQTGFTDMMEHETPGWFHQGLNDLWHLSTHKKYSGFNSWYCGQEGYWKYVNNMKAVLQSPPFILGPNAQLSYKRSFGLALYGTDGLFTEIFYKGKWDTLGYTGSGGALNQVLGISGEWQEEKFDLSKYGYGDTARVRFTFISDGSTVDEGVYIDDFSVQGKDKVRVTPYLGLQEPNGGNIWSGSRDIRWSDSLISTACSADVYISSDGGDNWKICAKGIPDSGSYNFITDSVPDGVRYKVGIYVYGDQEGNADISDSTFAINNPGNAEPQVILCYPKGGEVLSGDASLGWCYGDADNDSLLIKLDYTRGEDTSWKGITEISAQAQQWTSGSYDLRTDALPNDNNYKFRIRVFDGLDSISDTTNEGITVFNPHSFIDPLEHISGGANTVEISPYIIEPESLTGHKYEIVFGEIKRDTIASNPVSAIYGYRIRDVNSDQWADSANDINLSVSSAIKMHVPDPVDGVVTEMRFSVDGGTFTSDSFKIIGDVNTVNPPSADTLKANNIIDQYWPWRSADYEIRWHIKEGPHDTLDTLRPEVYDANNKIPVPADTSAGWSFMKKSSWAIGPTASAKGRDYLTYDWPQAPYSFIYICGSRFYFNKNITPRKMTWATKPEEGEIWMAYTSGQRPPHDGDIYRYTTTKVSQDTASPMLKTKLSPSWPNPFDRVAVIEYQLDKTTRVSLKVYNICGQLVKTLVDRNMEPGKYAAPWRGTDESGKTVSAGLYFYRLETDQYHCTQKMLFIK